MNEINEISLIHSDIYCTYLYVLLYGHMEFHHVLPDEMPLCVL